VSGERAKPRPEDADQPTERLAASPFTDTVAFTAAEAPGASLPTRPLSTTPLPTGAGMPTQPIQPTQPIHPTQRTHPTQRMQQPAPIQPTRAYTVSPPDPAPSSAPEYLRFGPGVPASTVPVEVAEVWGGTRRSGRRSRRRVLAGWLLPVAVLVCVLAILLWRYNSPALVVSGATVHATATTIPCDTTATIVGVLQTNGQQGTVTYRWRRSDGTVSGLLEQQVAKGTHEVDVSLLWTFDGKGTVRATANLEVISPSTVTAATTFTYTCN
jgi:hypothetical protein